MTTEGRRKVRAPIRMTSLGGAGRFSPSASLYPLSSEDVGVVGIVDDAVGVVGVVGVIGVDGVDGVVGIVDGVVGIVDVVVVVVSMTTLKGASKLLERCLQFNQIRLDQSVRVDELCLHYC